MKHTRQPREATSTSDGHSTGEAVAGAASATEVFRRMYRTPRLIAIIGAGALLDVLGPAQANYGGPGL